MKKKKIFIHAAPLFAPVRGRKKREREVSAGEPPLAPPLNIYAHILGIVFVCLGVSSDLKKELVTSVNARTQTHAHSQPPLLYANASLQVVLEPPHHCTALLEVSRALQLAELATSI